ncbi:MAG: class II fumarate hydratase [Spirochaetaceae bacterium]|nr:MAG: class II fumarate hydratase [Spirochaetaceae bacterium]
MGKQDEGIRNESDTMGQVALPAWAYWGAQTQRAVENFGVSDKRIPPLMIQALGLIKQIAAEVNAELGAVPKELAQAIAKAAGEVREGRWNQHFPIDVFQTGSGTSWNMNANEVIANRANELLGSPLGIKKPVHPNDHVNRGQSSNDVIPTAIHIADRMAAGQLLAALEELERALSEKTEAFAGVIKIGRTHLQDAVPLTLGQEFSGYASQIRKAVKRLEHALPHLEELALGGTAVGTGINAHPEFASRVIERIAARTRLPFRQAENLFEALACRDAQAELMGSLSVLAGSLLKIGNDLRLLSSGPRAGLGEIKLPSLQPGSSIMPGKVNPVIPEMVIQAAVYVKGKAASVGMAAASAPLELNIMMPLIAYETLDSLILLANTARVLAERCIRGIEADPERCADWVEWSLALVTPLATRIGYDKAAEIAYRAFKEKKTVRQLVREFGLLPPEEVEKVLDPKSMIGEE